MSEAKPKCCGQVCPPGSYRSYNCGKNASLGHDGKHYCKLHHPPTVWAKRDARNAKWDAEWEEKKKKAAEASTAADEQKRRADAYDQLVERVKELEETLQAVKHNQSASVAPIAYVDGDDAVRRILWEPTQAAFDIPVGTKLYTKPTPADAEDAARYRWLRRWKGQEHEPPFTVQHEIDGTLWGGDLDAAIDAALSKARTNTAEGE